MLERLISMCILTVGPSGNNGRTHVLVESRASCCSQLAGALGETASVHGN